MSRLLDDLLEVSRITQNKIHLRAEAVRLDEVIQEAVRVVQPVLVRARLTCEVEQDDGPSTVIGDPARLQQMVVNLLMNAVKYTPAGGQIRLELRRQDGAAVLRVKDTGIGIRPEILAKVFDLFVQADDSLDRSSGGLGVGLTLVRAIAELHGGTVQAHSDGQGSGSEFTVRLPLGAAAAQPTEMPASEPAAPANGTVLLVEDNDDSRRTLGSLLKLDGYEVLAACDGQEGLEAIFAHRPAVAIVDIGLPVLDGYEVARRVRSQLSRRDVFLVALTGYGRPEDRRAVFEAGFDEHLVKPLKRMDLERVLEKARQRG
jgi:two-component system CheB/CheR fusion protein